MVSGPQKRHDMWVFEDATHQSQGSWGQDRTRSPATAVGALSASFCVERRNAGSAQSDLECIAESGVPRGLLGNTHSLGPWGPTERSLLWGGSDSLESDSWKQFRTQPLLVAVVVLVIVSEATHSCQLPIGVVVSAWYWYYQGQQTWHNYVFWLKSLSEGHLVVMFSGKGNIE